MNVIATNNQETALPFGTNDLDSTPVVDHRPPRRVRCYVKGCTHLLRVPSRGDRGEICPDHGIRCHFCQGNNTYSYANAAGNIIASPATFAEKIIGHPFKYESHRLGLERSEDALSWNVFRSLEECGLLHQVADMITGEETTAQPYLYLWGICSTDDTFQPWEHLVAARGRFESSLPVQRPLTEPDIALYLPGKYLILIEAKFTSPNTYYEHGPRANATSLTLDELKEIYHAPELETLDYAMAGEANRIYYQLWRNMIFAEWMAKLDHPSTKPYHVNLVCEGREEQSAREFHRFVKPPFKHRFQRMTWEQIYHKVHGQSVAARLVQYLKTKTAGLQPAFPTLRHK